MRFDTQLLNTILGALGRDDRLRHSYLRRRWQGWAERGDRNSSGGYDRAAAAIDVARFATPRSKSRDGAGSTRPSARPIVLEASQAEHDPPGGPRLLDDSLSS
jgi:hypothetical protein